MNFRVGIGVKPHMVQIQTASVPNENKKFHCAEDITWNALKQNKSQTWENDHIILMLERITMQKTRYFHVLSVHVGLHSAHACTLHVPCTRAWWMKCPNKHNPFLSFVYYSFNFNFLHFLSVSEIRVAFLKLKKKKRLGKVKCECNGLHLFRSRNKIPWMVSTSESSPSFRLEWHKHEFPSFRTFAFPQRSRVGRINISGKSKRNDSLQQQQCHVRWTTAHFVLLTF